MHKESLTLRPADVARRYFDGTIIALQEPISIKGLFDGNTPSYEKRPDHNARLRKFYHDYAAFKLHPMVVHSAESDITSYTVIAPPVNGLQINHFLYFPAPYKHFGLDTSDIVYDWKKLLDSDKQDLRNEGRLYNHRALPHWNLLERRSRAIRRAIEQSESGLMTPVIRIVKNKKGHVMWDFTSELEPKIAQHMENLRFPEADFLVGLMIAASYSPDVHHTWPERKAYPNSPEHGSQLMGPTQVMALALGELRPLLGGSFMRRLRSYMGI